MAPPPAAPPQARRRAGRSSPSGSRPHRPRARSRAAQRCPLRRHRRRGAGPAEASLWLLSLQAALASQSAPSNGASHPGGPLQYQSRGVCMLPPSQFKRVDVSAAASTNPRGITLPRSPDCLAAAHPGLRSTGASSRFLPATASCLSVPARCFVGVEGFLCRPQRFRHVLQADANPRPGGVGRRIESTSTSASRRCLAASGWRSFQRPSPASAASFFGERAISIRGCLDTRLPVEPAWRARARPGWVHPLACSARGHGASPCPAALAGPRAREACRASRVRVDLAMAVADLGETLRGMLSRVKSSGRHARAHPSSTEPTPRASAVGAPSRRCRPCGPWRSGCSR